MSDNHEKRLGQLEELRYFVRSFRRSIEDLDPIQQDRLVGWLQKLSREFNSRGFSVSRNQQKFLENLLQFLGVMDTVSEVSDLSILNDFGSSELHDIIYKIFLIFTYLHDNSFDTLKNFDDILGLFKLSDQNKIDLQRLLAEEKIPLLGLDGLINMYNPSRSLNSFKPEMIYAAVREIHTHPLLKTDVSDNAKILYIQGFALLAEGNSFCDEQRNYLRVLANVLNCASALEDFDQLCLIPQKFQVREWIAALDNDMMKYSWLLDGAMILYQLPGPSKNTVKTDSLEVSAKVLRVMQAKDFIRPAVDLCLTESATDLYRDIKEIVQKTDGWEHILEYRNLSLHGAFDSIIEKLDPFSKRCGEAFFKRPDIFPFASFYSDMGNFDEDISDKIAKKMARLIVRIGRFASAAKLQLYYNKVISFIEARGSAFRDANSVLATFSMKQLWPANKMVECDLDNSALNEDWSTSYLDYLIKIGDTLDSYSNTASDLIEQLRMFEKGQYHISILESRKTEKEEKEKQKKAERESQKCIEVSTDYGDYWVGLSWNEINTVPFALDDISKIGYAGENWFVMANEPYYLDCNLNWHKIHDLPLGYVWKLFQVNGYIVFESDGGLWFSRDCQNWKKTSLPTDDGVIALIYYQDKYVLYTASRRTYSYMEKVLIFKSEEEGSYYSTITWQSSSLDGTWKRWEEASYTREGMHLESRNIACNSNVIIGGFCHDLIFKKNKKKGSDYGSCVAYFKNSKWKDATWPEYIPLMGNFYFLNNRGIYICGFVLLSENGYEWKVVDGIYSTSWNGGLCGNVFMTEPDDSGQSLISLDGRSIQQLTVSEKRWKEFGFGDGKVLGVYPKSEHESSLLLGTLNIIKK